MHTPLLHTILQPANLLRRKLCPGSARLELATPDSAAGRDSDSGAEPLLLHRHFADPTLDRHALAPGQRSVLRQAERLRASLLTKIARRAGLPEGEPFTSGHNRRM